MSSVSYLHWLCDITWMHAHTHTEWEANTVQCHRKPQAINIVFRLHVPGRPVPGLLGFLWQWKICNIQDLCYALINKSIINQSNHHLWHKIPRSVWHTVTCILLLYNVREGAVAKWGYIIVYLLACCSCWSQGGISGEGVAVAVLMGGSSLSFPVQDVTQAYPAPSPRGTAVPSPFYSRSSLPLCSPPRQMANGPVEQGEE